MIGLGEERLPPGEAEDIARIEAMMRREFDRVNPTGGAKPGGLARRDQHPKAHGCVAAELTVHADLPPELQRGLFREPGATYPAWVRFSSSSPEMRSDHVRDAHGMAIKVLGVPGAGETGAGETGAGETGAGETGATEAGATEAGATGSQDFVLANSRVFFVRSAADYVRFLDALLGGRLPSFFFPGLNPFRWRLRELVNLLVATRQPVANPLQIQYWSQTASRFGEGRAAKFSARPVGIEGATRDRIPQGGGPDFLREAMARTLRNGSGARFEFLVQLQADPVVMPVEDPTVRWPEARSPFRPVATLRIPAQPFDTPERDAFAEHLSFTPWHGLPDHRPLGYTNRVRQRAYELISTLRHERNGVPPREPAAGDDEFPWPLFASQAAGREGR